MQVAFRETGKAKWVQDAAVFAHQNFCHFLAHADHLVAMIAIGDNVDVREHCVEHGEIIRRESAHSA